VRVIPVVIAGCWILEALIMLPIGFYTHPSLPIPTRHSGYINTEGNQ